MERNETENLLEVKHLSVSFDTEKGEVQAVRDVSFTLKRGEILVLAGESGSGKSVLCKSIMKLLPSSARIKSGSITVCGTDITGYRERDMRRLRGRLFSMVFQNPMTFLNPSMTVGAQIAEAVKVHNPAVSKAELEERVEELMRLTGIDSVKERRCQYPHQFSGGMRQRAVLAAALAADPDILFADEPTTALDVTIQAQILDLFREIIKKLGAAAVFVTHDLGAAARAADRVAVMYAGKIVETGTAEEIYYDPRHPYTWGLMQSLLANANHAKDKQALNVIPGMPPVMINPPKGDAFASRNVYALRIDYEKEPPMFQITDTHFAASWLLDERAPKIPVPPGGRCWQDIRQNILQENIQPPESAEEKAFHAEQPERAGGKQLPECAEEKTFHAEQTGRKQPPESVEEKAFHAEQPEQTGEKQLLQCAGEKALRTVHSEQTAGIFKKEHAECEVSGPDILLDVRHLSHVFYVNKKTAVRAVDDVSFQIRKGEIFALVGESGSGKSTIARCVMNIVKPSGGSIFYKGLNVCDDRIFRKNRKHLMAVRQMIFQDSDSSLNPRMKVCDIIAEPMRIHHRKPKRGSYRREAEFQMYHAGLDCGYLGAYPYALSGGQRQRVAIARALAMEPELLVADEPTASLDVSIQAQIINLFRHLQKEHGFSFLFISHDLPVVEYLCDRAGVLYRGKLVECAPVKELFSNPQHPYTRSLLSAVPLPDPLRERNRKMTVFHEKDFVRGAEWIQTGPGHYVLQ